MRRTLRHNRRNQNTLQERVNIGADVREATHLMSTEGEACTWVTEFHYYPILSCLISNNSRCVDITRTYLLLHRLSQTGRENREESQSWMTASPQSSYLHDSQAIAQEQKLSKHHYINASVSMAYFPQISGF